VAEDEIAGQSTSAPSEPKFAPPPPVWEQPQEAPPKIEVEPEPITDEIPLTPEDLIPLAVPTSIEAPIEPKPEIKKPEPAPRLIVPKKKPLPVKEPKPPAEKSTQAKQEVLQFEPVTRGRFEKSEPTIVEGQDLDVPTFLRKNIRVK
jgi:cell division protein FtsZ